MRLSGPHVGRDIVILSLEPWDQVWRRNQHLAAELLRAEPALRVLFVEPAVDPLYALARRSRPRMGRGLRLSRDRAGQGRLWLYEPTKGLPRRLARYGDRRRAHAVLGAAERIGFDRPLLWFNDPGQADLLDLVDWPALYDVTDDWLAAKRAPAEHERLARGELRLLARCAEVTVCSPALARAKGIARPVTLITNGVDLDRYREPVPRPRDLPEGATAVYVGTLHRDRLDVDLCSRTAVELGAEATLVLVGPVALDHSDTQQLRDAGAILLGARPSGAVPGYLQHADILVVPHIVDLFTDSLDPIKLYEYRSVSRPIMSTPVAGFRDSGDPNIVVRSAQVFAAEVAGAIRRVQQGQRSTRVPLPLVSDLPTWRGQAELMRGCIGQALRSGRRV